MSEKKFAQGFNLNERTRGLNEAIIKYFLFFFQQNAGNAIE